MRGPTGSPPWSPPSAFIDYGLAGTIPPALGRLTELTSLRLPGNRLRGTIPDFLGDLRQLWRLDLSGNDLTGTIPASLSRLERLSGLILSNNRLEGPVPVEFAELDLSYFWTSGNPGLCLPAELKSWYDGIPNTYGGRLPLCE